MTTVRSQEELDGLARRASRGDSAALDAFLADLEPLVVRAARLVVGSGSWAAEDAAQEALLDLARGIRTLREPKAIKIWALRIATQRALKVSGRERLLRFRRDAQMEPRWAEPEDGRAAAIKEAFARLPPRLRATAVLRLHAGLSEAETADVLGCSTGTVKSNLHDARKQLTEALRSRGFAPSTMPLEVTSPR